MASVKLGQCYYLSIDGFAVYAYDAETDKELAAVSYVEPDIEKAIDSIKNQLCEARLVGARFAT